MPTPPPSTRSTAAKRRETVLDVAKHEFAVRGFHGGSTERIATAAGISQPYVFRLFGSKRRLFLAVLDRCMADTLVVFEQGAGELRGNAALAAIGVAYGEQVQRDPLCLQLQLVGYGACDDADVRDTMRAGFGRLVEFVEHAGEVDARTVAEFFARGMLLNVVLAMQLSSDPTDWGTRLLDGCAPPT
jgi:AcrR family transcriptional regulator